jgi:hypothetical protein
MRSGMRKTLMVSSLAVLVLGSASAHANVPWWSMNGAGCVPGDPAIQLDRYFITAGSVDYKSGASGTVTLYCPIQSPGSVLTCGPDGHGGVE